MNSPSPALLDEALSPLLGLAQFVSGTEWAFVDAESSERRLTRAFGPDAVLDYPLMVGGTIVGSMRCTATKGLVLDERQREALRQIVATTQHLLESERDKSRARASATAAHGAALREVLYSQRMKRMAHTDELTGLPNRHSFVKHWEDALARSKRRDHSIGLLLVDADRFKAINDTAGRAMGDTVLRAIGATLLSVAQTPDFAARIGADEFALCSVHSNETQLRELGERIRSQFIVVAAELGVDATISIGMVSSDNCPSGDMLDFADLALYRSKESGGDAGRLYVHENVGMDAANETD